VAKHFAGSEVCACAGLSRQLNTATGSRTVARLKYAAG